MDIALIGFGKVSYNLVRLIKSQNINFVTSTQNRSQNTIDLINKSDVSVYDSFSQAIENSDIIISANSPSQAIETAEKYGNITYLLKQQMK